MTTYYRQCVLTSGNTRTTAWISEVGAKFGKKIKLKESDEPDRLWFVYEVGGHRMEEQEVKVQERRHLKQRKASDI